jgi:hypothetical protein
MRLYTFLFLAALALALLPVPGRANNDTALPKLNSVVGVTLFSAYTENVEETTRAKEIFTSAVAQNMCTTGESSTSKESKATDHEARPSEAAYSHARRP